ncbi:MAG: glycosyltransferase family 9 protein [Planctomycetota bacterium]
MNPEYFPYAFLEELRQKTSISLETLEQIASDHQIAFTALLEILRWQNIQVETKSLQKKATTFRESAQYCFWQAQNPKLTQSQAKEIIHEAIQSFLGLFFAQRRYLNEAIQTLTFLLIHPSEVIQNEAIKGVFQLLVERLNDSFNPDYGPLYDHLFGEIVDFCRHQPSGKELDESLKKFHLFSASDLFFRKESLKNVYPLSPNEQLKKIILLSRVTLGADVAITSIIFERLKRRYPQAEIVFLASSKADELFGGDPRIRIVELNYQRKGSLIERLMSWNDAVQLVTKEIQGLQVEEYLVIDPDSRITQLGLLPLLEEDHRYLFFESRTFGGHSKLPLGILVNNWMNALLSEDIEAYPTLFLQEKEIHFGQEIARQLSSRKFSKIISLNLGVGGNFLKRIPHEFEFELVKTLLERNYFIFLDQGIGEELERTSQILDKLAIDGYRSQRIDEKTRREPLNNPIHLVAWNGGIGAFSGLIQQSQLYIGYDSAGQHIAAALGVPVIDIFAGFTHPQMTKRWKPFGKAPVKMVVVDTIHAKTALSIQTILQQILDLMADSPPK